MILAHDYTELTDTVECQPKLNFGGDICDPSDTTANFFETLYDFQKDKDSYVSVLQEIIDYTVDDQLDSISFWWSERHCMTCPATIKTFPNKKIENITQTKEEVLAQSELGLSGTLYWSPGLYLAAKSHTDALIAADATIEKSLSNDEITTLVSDYGYLA